jgi:ribosomal protein L7/L12
MQFVTDGLVAHVVDNGETIYTVPVSTVINLLLAHKADSERQYTAEQVKAGISRLLAGGRDQYLAAIKQYRIMTKKNLKEAKDYCDNLRNTMDGVDVRNAVETILVNGDATTETLIRAVNCHREMTGSDISIAKLYCERVLAELPATPQP